MNERPAPVEPVEAPTSDEEERLLETARAAQIAGTFPSDSAIRLFTDGYGAGESERRHCMAAARLALAYWGHAWGCLSTNHPALPEPAEAATPVDLDALLSPAGPYETGPGAGNVDGAQLVCGQHGGNPTWWAPVYGSDSLDDLLAQIRSRILPHLRPPVIGIDIPGPDGDWGDIADLCQAEGVPVEAGARLLRRARAAWGQGQSTPPAPAEPANHIRGGTEMVAPPAEGEVGKLVAALKEDAACIEAGQHDLCSSTADQLTRAADLLQQQAEELAVLGRPSQPPAKGEVDELVAWLSNPLNHLRAAILIRQQADELATLRRQAEPPVEGEAWSVAQSLRRRLAQKPMGSADPTLLRAAELLERLAGELVVLRRLLEPTPPAEGEAWEQVVWLRSLIGESVRFEPGSENASKLAHAACVLLTQSDQIAELQRQLDCRSCHHA